MKKIYIIGLLSCITIAGCTPDTEVLKVLREEKQVPPKVITPPVDLSKTLVIFSPSEKVEKIFRDPTTKQIEEVSFSFAPKFVKRELQDGESIVVNIVPETSQYERNLPKDSYTIEKEEINSTQDNDEFKVTLKKEAFKDIDISKPYVLLFRAKIKSTTPTNVPVEVGGTLYRIKLSFTEDKFPEGDNIEETNEAPNYEDLLEYNTYDLESNYAESHLSKLKDKWIGSNWWVDTNKKDIYLTIKFKKPTLVKGIKLFQRNSSKHIGSVDFVASPDGVKEFNQGTYTRSKKSSTLIIKFKKPIIIQTLKLQNFKKYDNQYIDITELQVW